MSYTDDALIGRLANLTGTQQSIQSNLCRVYIPHVADFDIAISAWILFFSKYADKIANVWIQELQKTKDSRKLVFLYLANDVLQSARRKNDDHIVAAFSRVLPDAFGHALRYWCIATRRI